MITTDTGEQYETKSHFLMGIKVPEEEEGKDSTTSTMPSGGNKKPLGELKDDSGTQVASSNKPIAPTWRDLRPDTYVPTEGAPSQQPKPIPIKPEKQSANETEPLPTIKSPPIVPSPGQQGPKRIVPWSGMDDPPPKGWGRVSMNTEHMPESENIEDRRQDPEMSKLELIARQSWDAYTKAWKKVMGTAENPKPQWIADEDIRKGRSVKPEHGAPGGPSGGGVPGVKAKIEDLKTAGKRFVFTDEEGKKIGSVNLREVRGGKDLYVDYAYRSPIIKEDLYQSAFDSPKKRGSNSILEGSGAISSKMLGLVKEHFPNAERVYGDRVSGAMGSKQYGLQFIRLKEPNEPIKRIETPYGKYDVPESAMKDFELSLQTAPVLRSDKKGIRDLLMKTGAERAF